MAGDEDRPLPGPLDAAADDGAAPHGIGPAPHSADRVTGEAAFGSDEAVGRYPDPVVEPPRPRSVMPTVLAVIGVVLILLLVGNLYTLYNPPGNDALTAAVAETGALKQRLAGLEAKAGDTSALDGRLTGLTGELQQLKATVAQNSGGASAGEAAKAALQPLDAKVADLGQGLATLQGSVAALPKVDLGPLEGQVAALDKRIVPLESYFNAPKSTAQVTEARQNGSAAETRAAPLAVIAQGVSSAIMAGRPFEPEVKALATLGVDEPTLAPLQAVAAKGAATDADLSSGFAGVQDGVVVATAPVETGTMFDRILANAQGIVKVTRTGAGTGTDAAAIASRITDALKRGDLPAASAAWDTLPAASKAKSADWAARLAARIKAQDAARSIDEKAVAALAAAP